MTPQHNLVKFFYEAGQLKRTPRTGWLRAGIERPESVAEHSWRVAIIAMAIAHEEGANVERAALLGLVHDLPETRVGDVGFVGKRYARVGDPVEVATDQTAALPSGLGQLLTALVREHEGAKSPASSLEARCSRDADKVEALVQAREYEQAGNRITHRWVEDMAAAVTTRTGRLLAQQARELSPSAWWEQLTTASSEMPDAANQ